MFVKNLYSLSIVANNNERKIASPQTMLMFVFYFTVPTLRAPQRPAQPSQNKMKKHVDFTYTQPVC